MRIARLAAATASFVLVASFHTTSARACGGFFCDRPPPDGTLPIAQSAENVLFVMDADPGTGRRKMEAHIQILYTGTAAQFSWVVPVTALPELDAGTDYLFQRIEPATRPSFRVTYQREGTCQGSGGSGCGFGASDSKSATAGGGPPLNPPPVQVVFSGNVGPYEAKVVLADDPQALRSFLTDNGYFISPDGDRIIDEYVAAHAYFVALRLQAGLDTTAIRPIVLRMEAPEACLPLKLTAIAATPNLRINVWVLAEARAVPLNYTELTLNLARLDWFNFGANYDALMAAAADEAGGNAFSVEYAQPSGTVGGMLRAPGEAARAQLAASVSPAAYLSTLAAFGFPLTGDVLVALRKQVPMPAALAAQGLTEASFYQNLGSYWTPGSPLFPPFDPAALTADLDASVFQPLAKVSALFASHRYLTRLATFISPEEMKADPLFVTNPDLPDVDPQHLAVANINCGDEAFDACNAPVRLRLEDRRDVWFRAMPGASCQSPPYDRADVDLLPAAEKGWQRAAAGEGNVVLDNGATIAMSLAASNAKAQAGLGGGCGCALRSRTRSLGAASAGVVAAAMLALGLRRRRRPR